MTKLLFIVAILVFSETAICQNKEDITLKEIKSFMKNYSVYPGTSKLRNSNPVIYFNKIEKIIEIEGMEIPISDVKVFYQPSESGNHYVTFKCYGGPCIARQSIRNVSDASLPFLNKGNCYDFINLIYKLIEK